MKKKKVVKEKKEKQLNFGLKNPPQNIYYKYKDQYELWLSRLETYKFMKDILMWFVLIMSASLITTQVYILQTLDKLPSKIPVFNYFSTPSLRLAGSIWVYTFPAISIVVLLAGLIFANRYYHRERELAKTIIVSILLATVSLSVILLKLVYTF